MNILVVDDEPQPARLLARRLGALGHRVTVSLDPRAAVDLFRAHAFDAVVTDLDMPILDGVSLAGALRAISDGVVIVFCTGSEPGTQLFDRAAEIGIVVRKHWTLAGVHELISALARAAVSPAQPPRDQREFADLFDELEVLMEAPEGSASARRRRDVEARLLTLVSAPVSANERRAFIRVVCSIPVTVCAGTEQRHAELVDLGLGGALLRTSLAAVPGESIEMVYAQPLRRGLACFRVPGTVLWRRDTNGRWLAVALGPGAGERDVVQIRRFFYYLLRRRLPAGGSPVARRGKASP